MSKRIHHTKTRIDYRRAFGGCPICGLDSIYLNLDGEYGAAHWFYCEEHRCKWCVGENLFGPWKDDTADLRRRNAEYLRDFREVKSVSDIRETADWIAGNRAAILNRLVAEDEAAAEAEAIRSKLLRFPALTSDFGEAGDSDESYHGMTINDY